MKKLNYKIFSAYTDINKAHDKAKEFINILYENELFTINMSNSHGYTIITVWYWEETKVGS